MSYRCEVNGCTLPGRGYVESGFLAPAHRCQQCSEEHCRMESYFSEEWRRAEDAGDLDWYVRHLDRMTQIPPQ